MLKRRWLVQTLELFSRTHQKIFILNLIYFNYTNCIFILTETLNYTWLLPIMNSSIPGVNQRNNWYIKIYKLNFISGYTRKDIVVTSVALIFTLKVMFFCGERVGNLKFHQNYIYRWKGWNSRMGNLKFHQNLYFQRISQMKGRSFSK